MESKIWAIVIVLLTFSLGVVGYFFESRPLVNYYLSFDYRQNVPSQIEVYGSQALPLSVNFNNQGATDAPLTINVTVSGATLICNKLHQTTCTTNTMAFKNSDYGTIQFQIYPNENAKSFSASISITTRYDGTPSGLATVLFAEPRAFSAMSFTYIQNSTFSYEYDLLD